MSRPEAVKGVFGHDWAAARPTSPARAERDFMMAMTRWSSSRGEADQGERTEGENAGALQDYASLPAGARSGDNMSFMNARHVTFLGYHEGLSCSWAGG